jgi:hypothetical protein
MDAGITEAGRQRIAAHLILCDACLDEVIAVMRHLRPRFRPPAG